MLELVDLMELEVIVAPGLGDAAFHRVGGFQQAKLTIAGLNHSGALCFKVSGMMLCPDKFGILVTEV